MAVHPGAETLSDVAVCIPVRNEEQLLPSTLAAVDRLHVAEGTTVHICLHLDGCTDGSERIALDYRSRSRHDVHVALAPPAAAPNAGRARRSAMQLGEAQPNVNVLLSTDADSQPAANWIAAMLAALAQADVVTGRVTRREVEPSPMQGRVEAYYDALFAWRRQLDPVAWEAPRTHHCAGGANMGFRIDAYRTLGGFAPLPTGEDARIVDDAGRAGLRVRRDADCRVETSDRRTGRTAGGLAAALRALDSGEAIAVAHPDDASWQYRGHALARRAFQTGQPGMCAEPLGLKPAHVQGVATASPNAEAFAMRIVPEPPTGMRSVPFAVAEALLARLGEAEGVVVL